MTYRYRAAWPRLLISCLFALAVGAMAATAFGKDYRVSASPDWVLDIPIGAEATVPTAQISNGVHYLLSDNQVRVHAAGRTHFRRVAMQALSEAGVDSVANLQFDFNPAFETFSLHSLRVHRHGRAQSRLEGVEVQVLQRERDLEARTYDGSKTANIFLSDVRVGDIVEYAYSLQGSNPAFEGRDFGSLLLQWSVPVQQLHARLLLPAGREFDMLLRNGAAAPEIGTSGGYREYRWNLSDLAPLRVDDGAPSWFDPYPRAHWSEFVDWNAVARWSLPMYQMTPAMLLALQPEITALRNAGADDESRLLAALRMVQGDIRYLGIQIGAGSYVPSPPALVLERRYGDCKDKTLLLMTLLKGLGIEASAALVNTGWRRGLDQLQPHPGVFNHVLVRARLAGRDYWLDPTLSSQSGTLERLHQPDYGQALLIDAETTGLVAMALERDAPVKRISSRFDSSAGLDDPVAYTVATVYEGGEADDMRVQIRSSSAEDLQHRYLNFYAAYFPGIEAVAPIEVEDDAEANTLTVREHYAIADFWPHSTEQRRREAYIAVPDMRGYLQAPSSPVRRSPLALRHPLEVVQVTEVLLPEDWPAASEDVEIVDPHFVFSRSTRGEGTQLQFTDRFRTLVDHVESAQVPAYAAKLSEARDELGYSLYQFDSPQSLPWSERVHWQVAVFALLMLGLSTVLAVLLYRYDPPASAWPPDPKLVGLRGWLLLPGLGVLMTPFALLFLIYASLPAYSASRWFELTDPAGDSYHPMWVWSLGVELGGNLLMLGVSVVLLLLFFRRRSSLPRVYVGVLVASLALQVFDTATVFALPDLSRAIRSQSMRDSVGAIFSLLIWGSYFRLSERVRSTFTRRLGQQASSGTASSASAPPVPALQGAS